MLVLIRAGDDFSPPFADGEACSPIVAVVISRGQRGRTTAHRYVIWRNNPVDGDRLRRIIDWANVA
jgi:hypothetical protein